MDTKRGEGLELSGDGSGLSSRTPDDPQADIIPALGLLLLAGVLAIGVAIGTGYALYGSADAEVTAKIVSERARCELYANRLAHVLNGGGLEVEGSTAVTCRAKHLGAS